MGKKKFIDKKKSATFHLLARDTSAASGSELTSSDRVFVRVDNNAYSCPQFDEDDGRDHREPDSIFADAPGDTDDGQEGLPQSSWLPSGGAASRNLRNDLPDHVRREILELGLPDDGYNYLAHLREIRNTGGGSYYYQNSKASLHQVPLDVKAYDASKLRIGSEFMEDENDSKDSMHIVASRTRGVRVQKVLDPDIANLLDEDSLSRFGSDVEDLEEDFVIKANLLEEDAGEYDCNEEAMDAVFEGEDFDIEEDVALLKGTFVRLQESELRQINVKTQVGCQGKTRGRRLLDEQFDLLTLPEYDNESESDDDHHIDTEHELLNFKLENTLNSRLDDMDFQDKSKDHTGTLPGNQESDQDMEPDAPPEVKCKTAEYAEAYQNANEDDRDVTYVQESSDESEVWDCETIVSTYSNLDNHPGFIHEPENSRKKMPTIFPGESNSKGNPIALRGREKLPVEYLPNRKKPLGKVKLSLRAGIEKLKPHSEESKEEKKERKAAVKEEKREARRAKKELKGLYRLEAQRAQKAVAVSGPSSISLK